MRAVVLLLLLALAIPAVELPQPCHPDCDEEDCRDCAACVRCVPPCPGEALEAPAELAMPAAIPALAEPPAPLPLPPARDVFHVPLSR